MPSDFNPFAPKQEEKARAEKLQGFFKGKEPRRDDLYEGSAFWDPLRGAVEGAQGMVAGGAKFAGAIADWAGDPDTGDLARNVASQIEYEMSRGWEAKGRGIVGRSFLDHPIRKTLRIGGQAIPSLLVGYGGGAVATKALLKAGLSGKIASAIGFTASTVPLAAVEAGDFYQEGLDAGKTPHELLGKTLSVMVGTAALERAVPLTWWLSPTRGAGRVFKTAIQEAGEEVAQGLWSNVHKVFGWKGTKDLYNTMMDGIAEGFVGGLLGGGLAGSFDLRTPKVPQVEVSPETTEQLHKIMVARGVKNDAGEDITVEDVDLMMKEGVKRIQKEETSIIKRLFEARGKIPNVKAMLQARQDETAYEEAKLVKDPNTGDNVIQMQAKGEHSKRYGAMLGKMVDEAIKGGKPPTQAQMKELIELERQRKKAVMESYEKLQYVAGGEHIPWTDLPVAFQTIIENEAPTNPVELQQFIDEQFNDPNTVWFMGGEADSERATVFYGPLINYRRLGWRSNEWSKGQVSPFAWIRDFVTYMGQMGVSPEQLTMRGDSHTAEAFKALLNKYSEITIGKPYGDPPTATAQDLEPPPGRKPTTDEVIANQVEELNKKSKDDDDQHELDLNVANDKPVKVSVTDKNAKDNLVFLYSIPAKDKMKSDVVRLQKIAPAYWQEYGSPEAFVANMKTALFQAWDNVMTNVKGVSRRNDAMYQTLVQRGHMNMIGMPVDKATAIEIATLFRNPSVEVNQVLYVKDGLLVGHSAHSINSPSSAVVSVEMIEQNLKDNGADGFYIVHNHPSGNPEFSDVDVTEALKWKEINEGRSSLGYGIAQGKYLGMAATNGDKYNFISSGVSEESHRQYISTPVESRAKLRTENQEVANFFQDYKTSQIPLQQGTGHIILESMGRFKKGKVAVIFGDTEQKFLAVEYFDEAATINNLGYEITMKFREHKASTYNIVTAGKDRAEALSIKNKWMDDMPHGLVDVYLANKQGKVKSLATAIGVKRWDTIRDSVVERGGLRDVYADRTFATPEAVANIFKTDDGRKQIIGQALNLEQKDAEAQEKRTAFWRAKEKTDTAMLDTVRALEAESSDLFTNIRAEKKTSVPPVTLEKIASMEDVFDPATLTKLTNAFQQAYESGDADAIKELEQNLDAYMEETELGITNRQIKQATEEFVVSAESRIITPGKTTYSKARGIAQGAGQRIGRLRRALESLRAQKTMNPKERAEINKAIRSREKALANAVSVKKAASSMVRKERTQRIKDEQYNANVAVVVNAMEVQDFQTGEKYTLPTGNYKIIRYDDANYGAIKLQGQGFEVDISMAAMARWAASDVKFVGDDPYYDSTVGDQVKAQASPLEGPDIKTDNPAPSEAAQRYDWKLNTFLRVGQFLGIDEEDMIKKLKKYFGDVERDWVVLDNKTDQRVLQDIVDKALTERNYAGFAEMVGRIAEDIVVQQVNDYVTNNYPHLEGVEKQDMIKFWLSTMNYAAEEVIAVGKDMKSYVYSNKGFSHYWNDGQIPGNINSEKEANVTRFKEIYQQVNGQEVPQHILSAMEGNPYRRGIRPQALYWSQLPTELQNLILWTKANVEDPLYFKMTNSDVLSRANNVQNRLNGYTHHAWRYDPKKEQAKVKGGKQILGSQRQPPRTYNTYAEFLMAVEDPVEGAGLQAMDNYATSLREYARNSLVSVNQRETIQKMVNTVDSNTGLPVVTWQNDKFILDMLEDGADQKRIENFLTHKGYKQLKNAEGLALRSKGAFFRPWVRSDIADVLDQFYADRSNPATWNAVNGLMKRIIMSSPYQFAMQIVSSPALWYSEYGLIGGTKAVLKEAISPLLPWNVARGMKEQVESRNQPFKNVEEGGYDYELVELFVKHGLKTFNSELILNSLYDHSVMDDHPLLRPLFKEHVETLKGKFGLDNYVFNGYVARNMFNYTKIFYDKGLAAGLDKEQAAKEAVKFSSDTSGMLNRNIYGNEGAWLQGLLFARDFTVSFFRQLTGASFNIWQKSLHGYKVGAAGTMNSFLHAEAPKESMNRLQKYYAAHLARIFAAKILFLGMAQFGLYFFRKPEDREEEDKWMLLNQDPGRQFAVKMPYTDENGSPVYIDPLLWREINQFINFFPGLSGRGPAEFIKGKLNVGVSQIFEQVSNSDYKGDPITATGGIIPLYKQAADRLLHVGKQITPPFLREEVKGLSNLSAIVGLPQKRGVNWGPGGTVGRANQVFRSLGRADYERSKINKRVKNATNKQLTEMYLQGLISREVYMNHMKLRQMKLQEIFRRNRTKILKQQSKDKR